MPSAIATWPAEPVAIATHARCRSPAALLYAEDAAAGFVLSQALRAAALMIAHELWRDFGLLVEVQGVLRLVPFWTLPAQPNRRLAVEARRKAAGSATSTARPGQRRIGDAQGLCWLLLERVMGFVPGIAQVLMLAAARLRDQTSGLGGSVSPYTMPHVPCVGNVSNAFA